MPSSLYTPLVLLSLVVALSRVRGHLLVKKIAYLSKMPMVQGHRERIISSFACLWVRKVERERYSASWKQLQIWAKRQWSGLYSRLNCMLSMKTYNWSREPQTLFWWAWFYFTKTHPVPSQAWSSCRKRGSILEEETKSLMYFEEQTKSFMCTHGQRGIYGSVFVSYVDY